MKKIEAIIRPGQFNNVKEALYAIQIHGMTVYEVHGCGSQKGKKEIYRGTEVFVDLIHKIKIEIVCHDESVQDVINIICEYARTGDRGDGKIFVYNIENAIRIRTGEQGDFGL